MFVVYVTDDYKRTAKALDVFPGSWFNNTASTAKIHAYYLENYAYPGLIYFYDILPDDQDYNIMYKPNSWII